MALFNQSRSTIIRLIFLGIFLIIIVQLLNLQVFSGKYEQLAMDNAVFPKVKYPDRGIIFDRKNRAILNNTIMYDLVVTPSESKHTDTFSLCDILGIDTAEYKKRMLEARFKNGPYRPSIFEDLLTPELHARLDENIWKFPGFALVERPVRVYPFNAAAHILGYIGEADSGIIKRSKGFYRMGDYVGRSGLESYYESILMGTRGVQYMIKDNRNRLVGSYENGRFDTAAIAGRNLRTSIDMDLQQLAEKLITNKVGAVVAIDPKTGGILAMASGPNYDPNSLTGPNKQKNYGQLALDVAGPLLNRAIQGNYEPGSTFKPLGALIALDEGVITPSYGYPCGGRYFGCGHGKPACTHSNPGHAANLRLAIANSCNSYFVQVYRNSVDNPEYRGVKKGYEKWRDYLNAFGLGQRTGVDLTSELPGLVPDTSRYNTVYRGSWNSCTNLTLGIGQDMMNATPLQLANAMCIVANKGFYFTPHFVQGIDGQSANDTLLNKFKQKHEVLTKISDDAYEAVHAGMQQVIDGTSSRAKIPGINVCGKTGTAEKFRIIQGRRIKLDDNSVFVCFAPREDPKIALAVIVENSGFGNTWAAPIAGLMMERYLKDSLPAERLKEVDRIAHSSLLPSYIPYLQYIEDSARAANWLQRYKDSSALRKFMRERSKPPFPRSREKAPKHSLGMVVPVTPDPRLFTKNNLA
ncbi:penicillin-binding protein 2 [Paraflavitalea sp. CAU 1676]|uniref:penicillin-binding protein 2 n=1 Tax=Paraflavitalea sp. CAU 1676 TaxID=3032598 RepID=UPI0023DA01A6|nr:penicillin-binding protein 2 [Paraflavitalea sp. CAU 1676]MDF2187214.1 penicillin-binding protein 2 [Paraflavitalea sp. CAU 1676]